MNLPSITALQALVTLSRTGSITATARTMSVTQSAISHKLKGLEQQLGFALVHREGRGVRLTERARHYVADVAPALDTVRRASHTVVLDGVLVINIAPGFATSWLAPRLNDFLDRHPGVALRVNTPRGYGDLGDRRDDLYVSFLLPTEVPDGATKLMDVAFFPVAAPALVAGQRLSAGDLVKMKLLHLDTRRDWERWCEAAQVDTPKAPGVVFQDMQIMDMAARAGQGVSLGDQLTSQTALEQGALLQVSDIEMTSQRSYWLVAGSSAPTDIRRAFAAWLSEAL